VSPSYSALSPVSAAIYTALNVAALTDLLVAPDGRNGGVSDVIPQGTPYPMVLFEVSDAAQVGGFGTKPGSGQLPEMDVRVHVFSQQTNLSEAQGILAKAIELLTDPPPAVTGYSSWAIFHDSTIDLGDQVIANITVHEIVATFRLYVEQTGA